MSEDMVDDGFGAGVPDESEQLDQISKEDGLIDRGVDDLLDEGYVAPDNWSPAQGYGNTPAEMRQGETIDMRIAQEQPEETPRIKGRWNPTGEDREVGVHRAGRLISLDGIVDREDESLAAEVGLAGGAASAEEAAVHIIDEAAVPDLLDEEYQALEEDEEDGDGEQ